MHFYREFRSLGRMVVRFTGCANAFLMRIPESIGSTGLEAYLADVQGIPAISDAEAKDIFQRAALGDADARERIVLAHLSLVTKIAYQYSGYGLPLADIISEGNLGLLRAAELFDPQFRVPFTTYASVWIKQRIHRAITAQARVVRIPVWRSQRLRKLDRLHAELNAELGRDASLSELGDRIGLAEEDVSRLASDRVSVETLGDHEIEALADGSEHPASKLSRRELMEEAMACLDGLDDTELQILGLKFGLLGESPESYREMAPVSAKAVSGFEKSAKVPLPAYAPRCPPPETFRVTSFTSKERRHPNDSKKISAKAGSATSLSLFHNALIEGIEPLKFL